jgi:hypothetical protein
VQRLVSDTLAVVVKVADAKDLILQLEFLLWELVAKVVEEDEDFQDFLALDSLVLLADWAHAFQV